MPRFEVAPSTVAASVAFRTRPNWTAVLFFLALGLLHLSIAVPAFYHGRFEGYLSLILGSVFAVVSVLLTRLRCEVSFMGHERRIRLRHGMGRLYYERSVGFDDVHAVRLTATPQDEPRARIEVLCDNEDFDCPITERPRQQALCLAVLMGVQLIRVSDQQDDEDVSNPELSLRL